MVFSGTQPTVVQDTPGLQRAEAWLMHYSAGQSQPIHDCRETNMVLSNPKHPSAYRSKMPRVAHKAGDQAVGINFCCLSRDTLGQKSVMSFPE